MEKPFKSLSFIIFLVLPGCELFYQPAPVETAQPQASLTEPLAAPASAQYQQPVKQPVIVRSTIANDEEERGDEDVASSPPDDGGGSGDLGGADGSFASPPGPVIAN